MLRYKLLSVLCLLLFNQAFSQTLTPKLEWAKSIGYQGGEIGVVDTEIDVSQNLYTIGFFEGTIDFDPGTNTHFETSINMQTMFISKLDSAGNFIWVKVFSSTTQGGSHPRSIDVDQLGNLYSTGDFHNTLDFDPDSGTFDLISNAHNSIFVLKMDSNGSFIWAHGFGSSGANQGVRVIVDESNNVVVCGMFMGSVDFDPDAPVIILEAPHLNKDAFILKLSSEGGFIWAKGITGSGDISFNDMACDLNNAIILIGSIRGATDFDPGPDSFMLHPGIDGKYFTMKLSNNGEFEWAFGIGKPFNPYGYYLWNVVTDLFNNAYVSGYYNGEIDFDPGDSTYFMTSNTRSLGSSFVQKLTSSGDFVWAIGDSNGDAGPIRTIDAEGNLFCMGTYLDVVMDLDPSSGSYNTISGKYYIQKLDSSGSFIWARRGGSHGNISPYNLHLLESNNFLVTGNFFGGEDIDFDPDSTVALLSAPGLSNMFVLKFEQKLAVGTKEVYSNSDFIVYPNPTTSSLIIETDQWVNSEVVLYDVTGNMVLKNTLTGNSTLLDISSAPTGIYFVTIISENGLVVKKVIKQ